MTMTRFHDIIRYPKGVKPVVLDLSDENAASQFVQHTYTIGRYDEKRSIYTSELFQSDRGPRCIHLGIDLGAPAGTPVYAPCEGRVLFVGYNAAHLDYGFCLVTEHALGDRPIYFLFGHLGASIVERWSPDLHFCAGDVLGYLGSYEENGHWPPHLHFQLSWQKPTTHDLPGVCTEQDRDAFLKDFPDPRLILGPIY
jgi:murein DD-endopeptidase MepM/ murein hydrolase activator NlpD